MSAEQIAGTAMMGLSLASTGITLQAAQGLMGEQMKLTTFTQPRTRRQGKLLRRNHKPVFRVIAYESKRHGLIVPKQDVFRLPSTATTALGMFFEKGGMPLGTRILKLPESPRKKSLFKSSMVTLKADTVRKMILG